jgi:hypothetical protein
MVAPIAIRELLIASRRAMTWRIRLGMTSVALVICFFAMTGRSAISSAGQNSFNVLTILALIYTLAAGFLFTACSISEERREGTFGLLYLTPLSSWDVIAGKLASTSLQGFFGLIAILPVLFLPLLSGGVTGQQLMRVVLVLLVTLLFSLSAGMFASASARSSRGALGMTGMLVIFPLAFGWLGILLATVFSYVSEQERKKRANIYWLTAYTLLIAFQMWMVTVSGYGLVGSPGQAFWAASNPAVTGIPFLASVAAIAVTAVFYLLSASLCTEWYRSAREIAIQNEETEHLDDLIFPGLRSKGSVRDEPARWLLTFLQSPPLLFYLMLVVMLLANLGSGRAPTGFGMHSAFVVLGTFPYLIFNYCLARFCAAPFWMLERSGFMETLMTTPLRVPDLVRAQRKIFWLTLKLPLIFLVLSSIPAALYFATRSYSASGPPSTLYITHWIAGWIIFALQLETISMTAMLQAVIGRKPMNAAMRTMAIVITPGLLLSFTLPFFWSILIGGSGGISVYFALQLVGEVLVATYLSVILHRARARLNLQPNLFSP